MTIPSDDRSTRLVRWWVRSYTAGLDMPTAAVRRAEIDSDLAEHERCRRDAGWPSSRLVKERLGRTLAGVPADIGWRHDRLRSHASHKSIATVLGTAASLAQLALAAYFLAFAAYLLGNTALSNQQVLGRSLMRGFDQYADEPGAATAGIVVGSLGLVLAVAAAARPISPVMSNAVTIPIAVVTVMFFWLGVWPLGLFVLLAAGIDLVLRSRLPTPG